MATTSGTAAAGRRVGGVGMLADRWWVPALRGAAAVIFGILTFISPGASVLALVVLFGVYAIVNGALLLGVTASVPAGVPRWGWLLFESIASIVAGVLALIWPAITALVLVYLIAVWAIATGIGQVIAAVRLRETIRHEWLLGLMGVLSIAFGLLLAVYPGPGAVAVVIWIGAYAIVFGALLIALGLRLRSWGQSSAREAPTGAIPVGR